MTVSFLPFLIDHWRPVHDWKESQVWEIIKRHRVNPHPAYHLGFGRTSCLKCIFGSPNQWATVRALDPEGFQVIADFEQRFGVTIHRAESVTQRADRGTPYPPAQGRWRNVVMSRRYREPVLLSPWTLPAGAFGKSTGPT